MSYCEQSGDYIGDQMHDQLLKNPHAWLRMNAGQTVKMNCKNDAEFHAYCAKQFAKLEKEQSKLIPEDALKQSQIANNLDQENQA